MEVDPVTEQGEAYNARDVDRFLACYSADVRIEDGVGNIIMEGHDAMRAQYSSLFEASPELHGRVVNRIVVGKYVIDEEEISGRISEGFPDNVHAVAIYRVEDDKIVHVRFLF
jgi:hypothetical protein